MGRREGKGAIQQRVQLLDWTLSVWETSRWKNLVSSVYTVDFSIETINLGVINLWEYRMNRELLGEQEKVTTFESIKNFSIS